MSQETGLLGSGGEGRAKVREITDLLGVSKSLMRPPLRSWRWEKGLMRIGVDRVRRGDGGRSTSDLLRQRHGSVGMSRECFRLKGVVFVDGRSEKKGDKYFKAQFVCLMRCKVLWSFSKRKLY